MRNLEEYNGAYREDQICIIIGAGFSLHFQDLSILDNYLTISVNTGFCAYPKSTFWLSDDWSIFRWNLKPYLQEYNTTVLLYEDKLAEHARDFGKNAVLFRHRSGYWVTDEYRHEEKKFRIFQCRTSLSSAIHVAHIMGCSKVVVLGLDCCRHSTGLRYFWQFPHGKSDRIKPFRNDGIANDVFKPCTFQGVQTDTDLKQIKKYWEDQTCDMRKKIKIYNASPYSVLGVFPKVKLSEFLEEHGDKNE